MLCVKLHNKWASGKSVLNQWYFLRLNKIHFRYSVQKSENIVPIHSNADKNISHYSYSILLLVSNANKYLSTQILIETRCNECEFYYISDTRYTE